MATFSNIDGEESATVTFRVGTVQISRGSTAEQQEILCLGDPETSNAIARITATAPDSTVAALNVRIASGPSSLVDLAVRAVLPSTATDNPVSLPSTQQVRVYNSTSADLLAHVAQQSTVWAVQVDGRVRAQNSTIGDFLASVQQNSTTWAVQVDGRVRAQNSTITDLLASVQQNSTVWQTQAAVRTSSGGNLEGSTDMPAQGVLGLHVREVPSSLQTFAASTVGENSTATVLVSSQANPIKVHAFSVTSTVIAHSTVSFRSSLAEALLWPLMLGSGSSGITGANLAVTPPAYLFRTQPNNALIFHTPTAGPQFHVAVTYST